jgi:hypothetical protein
MRSWVSSAAGFAFLLAGLAAHAQSPVYKLQRSDGSVVYSDKKLPATRVQKELTADSELSVISPIAADRRSGEADRLRPQVTRFDHLWAERNQARADLQAARRAKVEAEEPLPGERTANATGGSRLNEAYWERQQTLERAVERAERRLERAERALRDAGS